MPREEKKGKGQHTAATVDMEGFASKFNQKVALITGQSTGCDCSLHEDEDQ